MLFTFTLTFLLPGVGVPGILLALKLSSKLSSLANGLPFTLSENLPPELNLLPSTAFLTHGLPPPLAGELPAPQMLAPTPLPASGDAPIGLPSSLACLVEPSVAARLELALFDVERVYRGGVTYMLPGVSGADDGPKPRRARWFGVRGTSDAM